MPPVAPDHAPVDAAKVADGVLRLVDAVACHPRVLHKIINVQGREKITPDVLSELDGEPNPEDLPKYVLDRVNITVLAESFGIDRSAVPGDLRLSLTDQLRFLGERLRNRRQQASGLALVAVLASGDEVVGVVGPALGDRVDMVDVQDDGRRMRAAVGAGEAVAF